MVTIYKDLKTVGSDRHWIDHWNCGGQTKFLCGQPGQLSLDFQTTHNMVSHLASSVVDQITVSQLIFGTLIILPCQSDLGMEKELITTLYCQTYPTTVYACT